jgi:hypothetical protein
VSEDGDSRPNFIFAERPSKSTNPAHRAAGLPVRITFPQFARGVSGSSAAVERVGRRKETEREQFTQQKSCAIVATPVPHLSSHLSSGGGHVFVRGPNRGEDNRPAGSQAVGPCGILGPAEKGSARQSEPTQKRALAGNLTLEDRSGCDRLCQRENARTSSAARAAPGPGAKPENRGDRIRTCDIQLPKLAL